MIIRSSISRTLLGAVIALIAGSAYAEDNTASTTANPGASKSADQWSGLYAGTSGGYRSYDNSKDNAAFDAAKSASPGSEEPAGHTFKQGNIAVTVGGEINGAVVVHSSK